MSPQAKLQIDDTHDPVLESWVESASDPATDFPLQNLPFGRFRRSADEAWRIGVAIGDQVLDVQGAGLIDHADMNRLMQVGNGARRWLRHALSQALRSGSARQAALQAHLFPQAEVQLGVPCHIGDYTDFYTGILRHHTVAVNRDA